jgi:hypothetical protein
VTRRAFHCAALLFFHAVHTPNRPCNVSFAKKSARESHGVCWVGQRQSSDFNRNHELARAAANAWWGLDRCKPILAPASLETRVRPSLAHSPPHLPAVSNDDRRFASTRVTGNNLIAAHQRRRGTGSAPSVDANRPTAVVIMILFRERPRLHRFAAAATFPELPPALFSTHRSLGIHGMTSKLLFGRDANTCSNRPQ